MRIISLLIILVVAILGIVLAELNPGSVTVNLGMGSWELPFAMVLIGTLFIGAVLGMVVSLGLLLRLKMRNSKLQREVGKVQVITGA